MNKKIISTVMLCTSFFTLSAFAQNNKASDCPKAKCATEQCKKADCKAPQTCPAERAMLLFDGTTLTADQKTRLEALNKSRVEKCKANKKELSQEARAEKRLAHQHRDSVMKAEKREYLDGVKEILTPEQYVIFLENAYIAPIQQGPRMGNASKGQKNGKVAMGQRNGISKIGKDKAVASKMGNKVAQKGDKVSK